MKIRAFTFIVIILILLFLTGCWDAYEIKDHTIITLVGVDKKNENVRLLGEYVAYSMKSGQSQGSEGSNIASSKVIIGEGYNFTDAKNSLNRKSIHEVFMGGVRAVVFSDNCAENGIEEYLNRIRGLIEFKKTINLFTTDLELDKLFDSIELETESVGFDIENLSNQLNTKGLLYNLSVAEALENTRVSKTAYLLGDLDVIGKKIEVTGYSILKGNKKIGKIEANQIKGINLLILKNAYGEYTINFEGVKTAFGVDLRKRKINVYRDEKGITFDIEILIKSEIINFSKTTKMDEDKMKLLEETISQIVKKDIEETIKTSQIEYGCDYLYFYKYFRAKYSTDFKNMNWNEKYKDAKFNVNVRDELSTTNLQNFN